MAASSSGAAECASLKSFGTDSEAPRADWLDGTESTDEIGDDRKISSSALSFLLSVMSFALSEFTVAPNDPSLVRASEGRLYRARVAGWKSPLRLWNPKADAKPERGVASLVALLSSGSAFSDLSAARIGLDELHRTCVYL